MATQTATATLARPAKLASTGVMLPAFTLWWREIVRFYRQTTRVIGVLASPLVSGSYWARDSDRRFGLAGEPDSSTIWIISIPAR